MSIILYTETLGELSGDIRMEKGSACYFVRIYQNGRRIYSNFFTSFENAKKALKRNLKNKQ